MICAIHQPQFIPWCGYFAKITSCDRFVILDNVQFKKNEWQNRNRIRAADKTLWITIPVSYRYPQLINQVGIDNKKKWKRIHLNTFKAYYAKAPFFREVFEVLEEIYRLETDSFSHFVIHHLRILLKYLGVETPLILASTLGRTELKATARLVWICQQVGADTYLSGEGAREYLEPELFENAGLELVFQNYKHPEYPQIGEGFVPNLSVLDLLFNCGKESLEVIKKGIVR